MSETRNTTQNETNETKRTATLDDVMLELKTVKDNQVLIMESLSCIATNQLVYLRQMHKNAEDKKEANMYMSGLMATMCCIDSLIDETKMKERGKAKVVEMSSGDVAELLKMIFS